MKLVLQVKGLRWLARSLPRMLRDFQWVSSCCSSMGLAEIERLTRLGDALRGLPPEQQDAVMERFVSLHEEEIRQGLEKFLKDMGFSLSRISVDWDLNLWLELGSVDFCTLSAYLNLPGQPDCPAAPEAAGRCGSAGQEKMLLLKSAVYRIGRNIPDWLAPVGLPGAYSCIVPELCPRPRRLVS